MKIRPINDWIIVKMLPDRKKSQGGIVLLEGVDEYRQGTVVATGPGSELKNGRRQPTGVEPGDHVAFHRAHSEHGTGKTMLKFLGEDQVALKPMDILFKSTEPVELG